MIHPPRRSQAAAPPRRSLVLCAAALAAAALAAPCSADGLRIGAFAVDATPPVGSPLAYDPMTGIDTPLSCRGVVFAGAGTPVVVMAIDWIGISNDGQTVFKEAVAAAVGTKPDRVAVHAVHQHDAPRCDFSAEALLAEVGAGGIGFDPEHALSVARAAAEAAADALAGARPVSHVGLGSAEVEKVASNRRILGPDGKVIHTRFTATRNPEIRAYPAGTIDPLLRAVSLWDGEEPLAVLTYYATHPQSYYRTGLASTDFPGMARDSREAETGIPHVHFTGAAGNIGAGKWNDGAPENRQVLADRVADGMRRAWEATERHPVSAEDFGWEVEPLLLPLADHLDEAALEKTLADPVEVPLARFSAALRLVWLRRSEAGETIPVGCLRLGPARILHMPAELFVEYQLAAQAMRPDLFVAMAAYGEYAPGYLCTAEAYEQGGYEASDRASRTTPEAEAVLMETMEKLLRR